MMNASTNEASLTYEDRLAPVAVILHGGFWKSKYGIGNSAIESLSPFFLSQGIATCEVEYRRVGGGEGDEGGYPNTNNDIICALSKLDEVTKSMRNQSVSAMKEAVLVSTIPDIDRIFLVGHSAGGYLALWSCSKLADRNIPFKPLACVALAPVSDLIEADRRR